MEFKDKKGRTIYLEKDNNTINAYFVEEYNRINVGSIQFMVVDNSTKYEDYKSIAYPEQMHIIEDYQRSGIATKIIEYAKQIYDQVCFYQDTGCGGNTDEIHYSDEGLQFKNFCESKKITRDLSDYEEDEYDY